MKDTNEFNVLLGSGVNAGYRAAEDGKVNLTDVAVLLDPLLKGEAGVQGIGNIPGELAGASIDDKVDAESSFAGQLGNSVGADDAYDLSSIIGGIQSAMSLAGRATKKETLTKVAAALNGPHAVSDGEWTAEQLAKLID